jgi:hypothetical protein
LSSIRFCHWFGVFFAVCMAVGKVSQSQELGSDIALEDDSSLAVMNSVPSAPAFVPNAASQPANPNRTLSFQFSGASWREVTEWLSHEGGFAIQASRLPEAKVFYQDLSRRYSVDETLEVIGELLLKEGFAFIRADRLLTFVDLSDPAAASEILRISPAVAADQLTRLPSAAIVRCRFSVSGLVQNGGGFDEHNITETLRKMLSPAGHLVLFPTTREAHLTDTARQLRVINDMLSVRGQPSAERVILKNQPSSRVLASLKPMVQSMDGREEGGQLRSIQMTDGLDGSSVIIAGDPNSSRTIRALIEQLDQPTQELEFESIPLTGLDVRTVKERIEKLLGTLPANPNYGGEDMDGRPIRRENNEIRLDVDLVSGRLWVKGTTWQRDQVRKLVDRLRAEGTSPLSDRVSVLLSDSPEVQECVLRAAELWRIGGRETPIILHGNDSLTADDAPWQATAIRVRSSNGQTTFASSDSVALNDFVKLIESLLDANAVRGDHPQEIPVRYLPASILAQRIREVIDRSFAQPPKSPLSGLAWQGLSNPLKPAGNTNSSTTPTMTQSNDPSSLSGVAGQSSSQTSGNPSASSSNAAAAATNVAFIQPPPPSFSPLAKPGSGPRLVPLDRERKLLVYASANDLALIRRLASVLDVRSAVHERIPSILSIKYRSAGECLNYLKQIYGDRLVDQLWMSGQVQDDDAISKIHVTIDEGTNSLLVNADSSDLDSIRSLLFTLDRLPPPEEERVVVMPLNGILQSNQIGSALVNMFGNEKSKSNAAQRQEETQRRQETDKEARNQRQENERAKKEATNAETSASNNDDSANRSTPPANNTTPANSAPATMIIPNPNPFYPFP